MAQPDAIGSLERHGDVLVVRDCLIPTRHDLTLPKVLVVDGIAYLRFLDIFYLPRHTFELAVSDVLEIATLRLKHFAALVDLTINRRVITRLFDLVGAAGLTANDLLLDFGSGNGLSLDVANDLGLSAKLEGVDICALAVTQANTRGLQTHLILERGPLPFSDGAASGIVSSFVFHFPISNQHLSELWRVLRPGGLLALNIYDCPSGFVDSLMSRLADAGFLPTLLYDLNQCPKDNIYLAARKPSGRLLTDARAETPPSRNSLARAGRSPRMLPFRDLLHKSMALPSYLEPYLRAPEIQRLREIGLCDVRSFNQPSLGAATRYEHSLGVAYLAAEALRANDHDPHSMQGRALTIAALAHDVVIGPFGHSLEYAFASTGQPYTHGDFNAALMQREYCPDDTTPIYAGLLPELRTRLERDGLLQEFVRINNGVHPLSKLVNSPSIDIDNIDNVFRMAVLTGCDVPHELPLQLARALIYDADSQLVLSQHSIAMLQEWQVARSRAYNWLICNSSDFAQRAILNRAIELGVREGLLDIHDWSLTDSQLLQRLLYPSSSNVKPLVQRLVSGRFFPILGFYVSALPPDWPRQEGLDMKLLVERRIREELGLSVLIHFVHDRRRSGRQVRGILPDGTPVTVGRDSAVLYTGVLRLFEGHVGARSAESGRDITSRTTANRVRSILSEDLGVPVREYGLGDGEQDPAAPELPLSS